MAKQARDGPQELHRLYGTYTRRFRTRSVRRVLTGLWHEFDAWDARAAARSLLIDATVVMRDERAHLLPANLRRVVANDERRWAKLGLRLVDRCWFEIDVNEGKISLPHTRLKWDAELERQVAEGGFHDRGADPMPGGTFPIASWSSNIARPSLAQRVVSAGGQLLDRETLVSADTMQALAALLSRLPSVDSPDADPSRLPKLLAEA